MTGNFDEFMRQLKETNATLSFFTDFSKVSGNVAKIAMKLSQLNFLLGKEDWRAAVAMLYEENSKCFSVLDILIAVRKKDKKIVLNRALEPVLVETYFSTLEGICEYIQETGLAEVFRSKKVSSLVDYVFGVEAGLDTNARKNRSGQLMASTVASVFSRAGVPFSEEVNSSAFPELKNLGKDLKRFDFVIQTPGKTFLVETNFYNSGGSKLNEVARSYSDVAAKINLHAGYEFVWITDGRGWESARNKLEEAFLSISRIYNLATLHEFVEEVKERMSSAAS